MLPSAIEYGMSIKDFWENDPELFWAYRFSYINKIKRESEIQNYNAWLQGLYFYEGVSIALANGFGKGNLKYPEMPYGLEENRNKKKKPKMTEQEKATIELKGRVAQVQALWKNKAKGKEESSTTEKREEVVKKSGKN